MARSDTDLAALLGDARLLVLFDGWCGICTRTVAWARARAPGRLVTLPSQTPGLRDRLGLTRAQTDREVWAMDREGRLYAGPDCVNAVLRQFGGGWPVLAWALNRPGIHRLEGFAYRTFARHRGRFSRWGLLPPCEQPGAECADGP